MNGTASKIDRRLGELSRARRTGGAPGPRRAGARRLRERAPAARPDVPLCANAVAAQSGIPSNRILPVSTRPVDAATVLVQVDAGGKKAACLVNKNGTVKSVQPPA